MKDIDDVNYSDILPRPLYVEKEELERKWAPIMEDSKRPSKHFNQFEELDKYLTLTGNNESSFRNETVLSNHVKKLLSGMKSTEKHLQD